MKETNIKKFLLDATPLVGTGASMSMMADLIYLQEYNEVELNDWYSSLKLIKRPTIEMFNGLDVSHNIVLYYHFALLTLLGLLNIDLLFFVKFNFNKQLITFIYSL